MISWTSATDGPSVGPILSTTHVGSGFVELNPTHGPQHQVQQERRPSGFTDYCQAETASNVRVLDRIGPALERTPWQTFTLAITSPMRTTRSG